MRQELSDDQARYMVLIDNILREDLSPIEEAEAVAQLVKLSGNRKEAVAERLGKGVTYVADRVAILALPEEVKRMLDERKLNVTQAKVILEIKGKQGRLDAARLAARLSLTATDLRARVQRSLSPSSPGEAGARVRSLSFSELSGGVVRLYDAFERFDLDSITDHQARITFRKQVRLLYSSLVRAQNELSRGLEPDEEGEE